MDFLTTFNNSDTSIYKCLYHPDASYAEDIHSGTGYMICSECGICVGGQKTTSINEDFIGIITNLTNRLNLPDSVISLTQKLFNIVHDRPCLKGTSKTAIAAACLYKILQEFERISSPDLIERLEKSSWKTSACVCKLDSDELSERRDEIVKTVQQRPLPTFHEICIASEENESDIQTCYESLYRAYVSKPSLGQLRSLGDYAATHCPKLGLSMSIQKTASLIAMKTIQMDILGHDLVDNAKQRVYHLAEITAASIYMASQASNDKTTITEISQVFSSGLRTVSEEIINTIYELMLPHSAILTPSS